MEREGTELAGYQAQGEAHLAHVEGRPQPKGDGRVRIIVCLAAVAVALASFFLLGSHFSDPESYRGTMEALDQKKNSVMSLMGASTGSSAAISLLPGDAGTPIAEKLVDLSSDFLFVLAAIYLEKYLLTILGFAAFKVLLPVSCALVVLAAVAWRNPRGRAVLLGLSSKLAIFAIAAVLVVPVSVRVSGMIESTYEASIRQTIETAERTTEEIESSADEGSDSANPLSFLLNVPDELSRLTKSAEDSLGNFIEALAVMIVTSCIIPILVLVFFLWLARIILGINIDIPAVPMRRRRR